MYRLMNTASPSPATSNRSDTADALAQPELRRYLEAYVRRRVAQADADDVIQSVLCAALEAPRVPLDREEVRKWITGIARHKLASHYAKAAREQIGEPPEIEASPAPLEASSLMRWVERQATLSEAERVDETLEWMARESDGEKLETIAMEAQVPATSVRQRVSRMRRWMKARWVAELAAVVAALLALSFVAWWLWGRHVDETAKERLRAEPSMSAPVPAGSTSSMPSTTNAPAPSAAPSAAPSPAPSARPLLPSPLPTTSDSAKQAPKFPSKTPTVSTSVKPTGKPTGKPGTGTGAGGGTGKSPDTSP